MLRSTPILTGRRFIGSITAGETAVLMKERLVLLCV